MKQDMAAVCQQLLTKAANCGLACLLSEQEGCRIQPNGRAPEWYLMAQDENWLLVVRGIPQIQFGPEEALKFLDRFAKRV
ncbi:MAG: hypothetical protein ACTS2F_00500 [Thainema sp.]